MDEKKRKAMVLGRTSTYSGEYDPNLLYPVPRDLSRQDAGINAGRDLAFGEDIWNLYELSWLDGSGRPAVAVGEIRFPFDSPHLIESKSLKLYCNSFNLTRFASSEELRRTMAEDLTRATGDAVLVKILPIEEFATGPIDEPAGQCIDDAPADGFAYHQVAAEKLETTGKPVSQTLFSRLFRSRCPVTGQPDWATVTVCYRGRQILPGSLLGYLISYREHQGFHEACVERIYRDIMVGCQPEELLVCARFTRRGGIDINPVRSSHLSEYPNLRDPRQ